MPNERALDDFMRAHARINDQLSRLVAAHADHFGHSPDDIDYGHFGDLGYVAKRLEEAIEFLGARVPENAPKNDLAGTRAGEGIRGRRRLETSPATRGIPRPPIRYPPHDKGRRSVARLWKGWKVPLPFRRSRKSANPRKYRLTLSPIGVF